MMKTNTHAYGVDDVACSATPFQHQHAFGVDDVSIPSLFQTPFPAWVSPDKRSWVSPA